MTTSFVHRTGMGAWNCLESAQEFSVFFFFNVRTATIDMVVGRSPFTSLCYMSSRLDDFENANEEIETCRETLYHQCLVCEVLKGL